MNEKKWHCLYTRSGYEKRVTDQLKRKGIEAYYPVTQSKSGDRRKTSSAPLFRTYVFARISETEKRAVLRTDGVLSFVHWLGKPVNVRDNEIQLMRMFIAEHTRVQVERTRVNMNEMVRIVTDNTFDFTTSQTFAFTNPIKIIFPSLGYAIIAETPAVSVASFINQEKFENHQQYQLVAP